jgi:hypothetical protein
MLARTAVHGILGLLAAACMGTAGWAQTTAANVEAAADLPAPANTQKAMIKDPTMHGMKAIEVTYPAGWHFKSDLYLAGVRGRFMNPRVEDCGSAPTGVFRATSPDGLSFVEQWPLATWGWANGDVDAWYSGKGCYPLHGAIKAQEYLKYVAAMLGVVYLADEPADATQFAKLQKIAQDANARNPVQKPGEKLPTTEWTIEMAEAMVGYVNGTFKMKGRLTSQFACSEVTYPEGLDFGDKKKPRMATVVHRCEGRIVYMTAPEDRFADVAALWDRPGMGPRRLDEWEQARAMKSQADADRKNDRSGFIRDEAMLSWRHDISHTQAVRQKMYEQFDRVMKLGLERAQAQAAAMANTSHAIAPDWVDLQLDTGLEDGLADGPAGLVSIPINTWTDATGTNAFEVADVDADPNGILAGEWTSTQRKATEDGPPPRPE